MQNDYLNHISNIDLSIFFIAGYASIRQPKSGSYFIRAFLSVAKEHYKEHHVEDILRDVRQKVSDDSEYEPKSQAFAGKCQMIEVVSTSRKKFFLESQ